MRRSSGGGIRTNGPNRWPVLAIASRPCRTEDGAKNTWLSPDVRAAASARRAQRSNVGSSILPRRCRPLARSCPGSAIVARDRKGGCAATVRCSAPMAAHVVRRRRLLDGFKSGQPPRGRGAPPLTVDRSQRRQRSTDRRQCDVRRSLPIAGTTCAPGETSGNRRRSGFQPVPHRYDARISPKPFPRYHHARASDNGPVRSCQGTTGSRLGRGSRLSRGESGRPDTDRAVTPTRRETGPVR